MDGMCLTKLTAESSANPPAQAISDILSMKELHSTLHEMNNSIKLLHDEVKFLRAEVVLISEAGESVYKTPISELEVAEESLDNTLTIPRDQATTVFGQKGQTRSFIDKLTSVIPSSGLFSDPFKGAKSKTSTPHRLHQYSRILNAPQRLMNIPKDRYATKNQFLNITISNTYFRVSNFLNLLGREVIQPVHFPDGLHS